MNHLVASKSFVSIILSWIYNSKYPGESLYNLLKINTLVILPFIISIINYKDVEPLTTYSDGRLMLGFPHTFPTQQKQ